MLTNARFFDKAQTIICLYVQASAARTANAAMSIMLSVEERAQKFTEARTKKRKLDQATSEILAELAQTSAQVCVCHDIYLKIARTQSY